MKRTDQKKTNDTAKSIIEVCNLVKKFDDFTAVSDVSFSVYPGEIFAFLGPNGAGKTTTIKILTTLLHPTAGSVTLNGFNPKQDRDSMRKSFGIVFQDYSLDDELTAWENMKLHAVLYKVPTPLMNERIPELLCLVELHDRKNDLVKTFSGGMKRRLEIARGLLHHPAILFLDEPTLGLDPQTRNHMWNYITRLNHNEGMTVFFTTHYLNEAEKVAHRIAIIDRGNIIASGTTAELKKQTRKKSLEEAYLALTGHDIRFEEVSGLDRMRNMSRMWRKR